MHNPATDTDFPGDSVATWQGQTLPEDSTSTDSTQTWTFSNLSLGNDISGGASVSRVYNVYAQGSSSSDYSVSDGSLETRCFARPGRLGPGQRLGLAGHRDPRRQ